MRPWRGDRRGGAAPRARGRCGREEQTQAAGGLLPAATRVLVAVPIDPGERRRFGVPDHGDLRGAGARWNAPCLPRAPQSESLDRRLLREVRDGSAPNHRGVPRGRGASHLRSAAPAAPASTTRRRAMELERERTAPHPGRRTEPRGGPREGRSSRGSVRDDPDPDRDRARGSARDQDVLVRGRCRARPSDHRVERHRIDDRAHRARRRQKAMSLGSGGAGTRARRTRPSPASRSLP